ncbi:MAG: MFS transporter [Spirochaetales bacterium]|nr:MFS transporter [Spirochaetales bacterium]
MPPTEDRDKGITEGFTGAVRGKVTPTLAGGPPSNPIAAPNNGGTVARAPQPDMNSHRLPSTSPGVDTWLLILGNAVSTFGNGVFLVALLIYGGTQVNSSQFLGLVQGTAYLPMALFSLFAGRVADRLGPRFLIVLTDLLRGVVFVSFGLGFSNHSLGVLLPLVFINGGLQAFFIPAVVLLSVRLEGDFHRRGQRVGVLGLRTASLHTATLAGNALGGILFVAFGLSALLVATGIGFFASGLSEMFIRAGRRVNEPLVDPGPAQKSTNPLEFLKMFPVNLYLLFQIVLPLLTILLPGYLTGGLGLPEQAVGWVFALLLAGSIGAGLVRARGWKGSANGVVGLTLGSTLSLGILGALDLFGFGIPLGLGVIMLGFFGFGLGWMYLSAIEKVQEGAGKTGGRRHGVLETLTSLLVPGAYFLGSMLVPSDPTLAPAWIFGFGLVLTGGTLYLGMGRRRG